MDRTTTVRAVGPILLLLAAGAVPGCSGAHVPEPASPTVSADSEAGKKARAEDQELRRERQERDARARRRYPKLPAEG